MSDILLTQDAYKIEPGWACRARPGSGVGDVPPPGAALFPRFRGRAASPDPARAAAVADRAAVNHSFE